MLCYGYGYDGGLETTLRFGLAHFIYDRLGYLAVESSNELLQQQQYE